eukprot:5086141-Ditylum_brightwellii.AAC.1
MYQLGFMPSKADSGVWMKDCKDHWEHRVTEPDFMLTWGAQTYVRRMLASYEQLFGKPVPKREVHAPLEPSDHPEIDDSPLLDMEDIKKYWQMIGEIQWA